MKIVIAVGGTGGHLFPAEGLGYELESLGHAVLCLGAGLKEHPLAKNLLRKESVTSSPLGVKALWCWPKGTLESALKLIAFKPDFVVGFGSYHSFPVLAAARLLRIPYFLHEQNAVGGKVNRLFASKAKGIGLYFENAKMCFGGKGEVVSMPLRKTLTRVKREDAAKYYGLDAKKKTLLIFGGSQGALNLNRKVVELIKLLDDSTYQVLFFTGKGKASGSFGSHVVQKEYEPNMHNAWSLADCALCRAGALTIAEGLSFNIPLILVPYPYASDDHQWENGKAVKELGAGVLLLKEEDFSAKRCIEALETLKATKINQNQRSFTSQILEAVCTIS